MERIFENVLEAEREIGKVDHMIYVTFPLIKEKNILLKSIISLKEAIVKCINSILQYEYLHKRIELSNNPATNFKLFKDKCSRDFLINEGELKMIEELFELVKSHKQSPMEFIKNGKVVILSNSMAKKVFSIEEVKKFLEMSKKMIRKTKWVLEKKAHS